MIGGQSINFHYVLTVDLSGENSICEEICCQL